jgi:hypothetical protein
VLRWLAEVFGRLREWGFAYYKLDFLAFVFSAHRYHDPTVPRGEVLRRAVKAIRDTVGPDAYVMAMPHFESLHGLLDAARIAGDIHNFWGHIRQNAVAAGVHYWKHGRIWNNDVDFAITRCAELSDDPHLNRIYERRPLADDYWFAGPEANLEECRTWLNICYLSAGEMILGDRLSRLSPQGIAMLRRVLDRLPAPARPLDLFSADCPSPRWRADTPQGHVMGYFNWQDHPVSMAVDPADWGGGRCRLRDFWTGESLPSGGFTLDLPPHHSRLIEVTVKRPKR